MAQETIVVSDFSGGITDDFVDGPLNCAQVMDNLYLDARGKPYQREGSQHLDTTYTAAVASTRVGRIFELESVLFVCVDAELYRYAAGTGWVEVACETSPYQNVFYAGSAIQQHVEIYDRHAYLFYQKAAGGGDFVRVLYMDVSNVWRVRSAGLPEVNWSGTQPTFHTETSPGAVVTPGAVAYYYAFHYAREWYHKNGRTYREVGPIKYSSAYFNHATIAAGMHGKLTPPASGWAAPTGSHETTDTVIYIEIYRLPQAGGEYQYVGQVAANGGSSVVTDQSTEALLGVEIYVAGDGVEYSRPPGQTQCMTIANDIAWYGNYTSGATMVEHSLQGAPWHVIEDSETDMGGVVTGLGAVGNFPIVFLQDKAFRLEGYLDSSGSGLIRKIVISDRVGCIGHGSIIQSQRGLCFAALDGFYFTDGYSVQKISENINRVTYPTLSQGDAVGGSGITEAIRRLRIQGAYDRYNDRYLWVCDMSPLAAQYDNDVILVFDAKFGIRPNGTFTILKGHEDDIFSPTAIFFRGPNLYRGHRLGYVYVHDPDYEGDHNLGTNNQAGVRFDYKSCAWAFGDATQTKWANSITVTTSEDTRLALQIAHSNKTTGDDADFHNLKIINKEQDGGAYVVERRFPAGTVAGSGLRFVYKQIRMTSGYVYVYTSDDYLAGATLATVAANRTAVTITGSTPWPSDAELLYLSVDSDSYALERRVVTLTSGGDVANTTGMLAASAVGSGRKWQLRGYPVDQTFRLEAYAVTFERFGNTAQGYKSGDDGTNA